MAKKKKKIPPKSPAIRKRRGNPNPLPPPKATRFKKGQSGNPKGRPKIPSEVRTAARAASLEAIETLIEIMRTGKDRDRLVAANSILDRAWGKPSQAHTITGSSGDDEVKTIPIKLSLIDDGPSLIEQELEEDN